VQRSTVVPDTAVTALVSDKQLEVVMHLLRAHSIEVDAQRRVAYRRRSDGKYEKITLRDAVLIAMGRRQVAS
jgi:hypothetical protein